jgi:hypothetical protein
VGRGDKDRQVGQLQRNARAWRALRVRGLNDCRHRGVRRPDAHATNWEAVERLFDEDRDQNKKVREDDWHPTPELGWHELDLFDTLDQRRRWCLALMDEGQL